MSSRLLMVFLFQVDGFGATCQQVIWDVESRHWENCSRFCVLGWSRIWVYVECPWSSAIHLVFISTYVTTV